MGICIENKSSLKENLTCLLPSVRAKLLITVCLEIPCTLPIFGKVSLPFRGVSSQALTKAAERWTKAGLLPRIAKIYGGPVFSNKKSRRGKTCQKSPNPLRIPRSQIKSLLKCCIDPQPLLLPLTSRITPIHRCLGANI